MRVVNAINAAMHSFLGNNADAYFIGEDVLDPYGGAFKVSKGLSNAYPDQVITTPISEAGITGLATGLAIKNRPVCLEIMFGDFITLSTDQIINHMSKLPWVYQNQIAVPVVIRTPMGGRRGYGSTHSQSLEKHFCGVPGLTVRALSQYTDIEAFYCEIFAAGTPHLVIENKAMYPKEMKNNPFSRTVSPDIVMISYGGCMEDCVIAATRFSEEEEINVKVLEITSLWPFDHAGVRSAIGNARCVLTVEEGTVGWGFASEVARSLIGLDRISFDSVSAPDHPIPSSKPWEDHILPSSNAIAARAINLLRRAR
jgi:pyruvate/2-oxoglutarate/acetoin dehydrogenase E1 component